MQHRLGSVLTKALGEAHPIRHAYVQIQWTPIASFGGGNYDQLRARTFLAGTKRARGLIDAAIFELEQLNAVSDLTEDAGFDPELWNHVSGHVTAEEWAKVASQTAIFTEDRIRKWANRPLNEVGEQLMTTVFGERGDYRLGRTESEKQGWHRLAMGISMALRNVDAHRIQNRQDLKRYATGVLGTSSLLLTQLRFEHQNRFHDTSSASVSPA